MKIFKIYYLLVVLILSTIFFENLQAQNNIDSLQIGITQISEGKIVLFIENNSTQSISLKYHPSYIFNENPTKPSVNIFIINPITKQTILFKYNINNSIFSSKNTDFVLGALCKTILDTIPLNNLFSELLPKNYDIFVQFKNPIINTILRKYTLSSNLLLDLSNAKNSSNVHDPNELKYFSSQTTPNYNSILYNYVNVNSSNISNRAYFISNYNLLMIEDIPKQSHQKIYQSLDSIFQNKLVLSTEGKINNTKLLPGEYLISKRSNGNDYILSLYKIINYINLNSDYSELISRSPKYIIIVKAKSSNAYSSDFTRSIKIIDSLKSIIELPIDGKIIPLEFRFASNTENNIDNLESMSIFEVQKSSLYLIDKNEFNLAMHYIDQAIKMDKTNCISYKIKSIIYFRAGNLNKAKFFYKKYFKKTDKKHFFQYLDIDSKEVDLNALTYSNN